MKKATLAQIETIRSRAHNQEARDMQRAGVWLSWDQADALGDEAIDWMRARLGLKSSTSGRGITFKPDSGSKRSYATKSSLVIVETMPEYLKGTHRAARNWGVYPLNGAVRECVARDEAEEIVASDPDGYAHIVSAR